METEQQEMGFKQITLGIMVLLGAVRGFRNAIRLRWFIEDGFYDWLIKYADSYKLHYRDSGSSGDGFLFFGGVGMAYRDLNRKHFVEGFPARN